jgi:hypothetical protein
MKTSQRKKLMSKLKKIHTKKSHQKERKILSKSMQGHSAKYE